MNNHKGVPSMTNIDASSLSPFDDFRARLEDMEPDKFTPHAEPLAWQCRCGGRMVATTKPGEAPIQDVVASLVDAARAHHAAGCRR